MIKMIIQCSTIDDDDDDDGDDDDDDDDEREITMKNLINDWATLLSLFYGLNQQSQPGIEYTV